MGADSFFTKARGSNASEAFVNVKVEMEEAHGRRGYTGTIAEKDTFKMVDLPFTPDESEAGRQAVMDHAQRLLTEEFSDKWGPAGCIKLGENEYLFFGFASS